MNISTAGCIFECGMVKSQIGDKMVRIMKIIFGICLGLMALFVMLDYAAGTDFFRPFAITAGTIAYHFGVRLFVGIGINALFNNRFDYNRRWFRQLSFEPRIYEILKVRKWKDRMPTANSELFDIKKSDFAKIASAMCQAEVVHEVNVAASFLPLIASYWFGDFWIFFITSLLSAIYDLLFVVIQRYNRPRFVKLAERKKNPIG